MDTNDSIQEAIDVASNCDTVNVAAGEYTENVQNGTIEPETLGKKVNLVGAKDASGNPLTTIKGSVLYSLDSDMNDNIRIENINFVVDTSTLLRLYGVNGATIKNCTFDGGDRYLYTGSADGAWLGIVLERGANNGNSNVLIDGCTFKNGLYGSIQGYITGLTVKDCTISDVLTGINHQNGGNLVVENTNIKVIAKSAAEHIYGIRFASSGGSDTNLTITGGSITVDANGLTPDSGKYFRAIILREAALGTLKANFINIDGGVVNLSSTQLDATNNWWGTKDATEIAGMVSANVKYRPYTGAGVTDTKSETTGSGDTTVDAKSEAGTEVEKKGDGTPTVTVAKYESNPGTGFTGNTGTYVDVHVDNTVDVAEIIIKVYYTSADIAGLNEASLKLRWWDGAAWSVCSDSGATYPAGGPEYRGYMWAKIRTDTKPSLDDLGGTAFAGGGSRLVSGGGPIGGGGGGTTTSTGTTNVRGKVSSTGRFRELVTAPTKDEISRLNIPYNTTGLDKNLKPLTKITMLPVDAPPSLPEDWYIIGLTYDFGPSGASFDPAITLSWKYKLEDLPDNLTEEDLILAYYDTETGEWVILDSTVDARNSKVTAKITHFTTFALIGAPKAAAFTVSSLNISPAEVTTGETATASVTVTNTGDIEGRYTVILRINGVQEAEKSVTIAAGGRQDISFNIVKETAGTYSVELNGLTGSLTVASVPSTEPPEPPEEEGQEPILTPIPSETTPVQTQVPTPSETNWALIWGVVAAGVVIIGTTAILWLRRRKA